MKQSEINELSVEELNDKLEKLSNEYASLKITHTLSSIENPVIIKKNRRTIARIKTELKKRTLEQF